MSSARVSTFCLLILVATTAAAGTRLSWIPGSTVKVEQMIGDCDYSAQASTGQCVPTASRTNQRAKVLGTDLGSSFETGGRLMFLFGDTIGSEENYFASDTIATSTSTNGDDGLVLDFLTNADGSPYFVRIAGVPMGAGEVPEAGIALDSGTYIACKTGTDVNAPDRTADAYSVLTRFDENAKRFTYLRVLSEMPAGRFISMAIHKSGDDVLLFGLGAYRASDVYLAKVPASTIESGEGTQYFTGLVNGSPSWSMLEADARPVLVDTSVSNAPWPDNEPTIGNVSVTFAEEVGLWLMTYDAGGSRDTVGVYFSYASAPWGPWSAPQLIFNPRREGAVGTFIHDPSVVPNPPGDGLNGPTIGPNDPATTPGGTYAPFQIERFTRVTQDRLSIYYTLSTWNPYTIVKMRSDFAIVQSSPRHRAVRH
jgi:hypothetical protein